MAVIRAKVFNREICGEFTAPVSSVVYKYIRLTSDFHCVCSHYLPSKKCQIMPRCQSTFS